jgi:hypothetical protein
VRGGWPCPSLAHRKDKGTTREHADEETGSCSADLDSLMVVASARIGAERPGVVLPRPARAPRLAAGTTTAPTACAGLPMLACARWSWNSSSVRTPLSNAAVRSHRNASAVVLEEKSWAGGAPTGGAAWACGAGRRGWCGGGAACANRSWCACCCGCGARGSWCGGGDAAGSCCCCCCDSEV